ncbi:MAG: hypothetical protein ACFFD2_24975 [Promethearchaeota archaeon]
MVIYELGIVCNGILLVSKEYYKEYEISLDPSLRGGIFSALTSLASEVFSDTIESFTLRNYKALLISRPHPTSKDMDIIAYCIGDKKINLELAKDALTRILDEFNQKYSYEDINSGNLNIYKVFEKKIDDILGDLAKSYTDRLKSIFG